MAEEFGFKTEYVSAEVSEAVNEEEDDEEDLVPVSYTHLKHFFCPHVVRTLSSRGLKMFLKTVWRCASEARFYSIWVVSLA